MSDIGRLVTDMNRLVIKWEAEAASPRAPLTADLGLEGAQVRRVCAAELRECLEDADMLEVPGE